MIIIIVLLLSHFALSQSDKKIPELDLRNSNLVIDIKMDNLFNSPIDKSKILIPEQIDEIKDKSRNFEIEPISDDDIVVFETNLGTMKINLFNDFAPNHCANFKKLSNSGFYDETLLFRIVPNFMIQGGDILTRDGDQENDGTGNPGWTINAEINNLKHKRGILSMTHGSDINSAGSQFFICLSESKHLDNNYTIFGEIVENIELLNTIQNVPSESKQILSLARKSIPEESNEEWITYSFNDTNYYFKIPTNETEESYRKLISKRINNIYRPSIPVIVKKIRVLNKKSLSDEDKKNKLDFNLLYNKNKKIKTNNE